MTVTLRPARGRGAHWLCGDTQCSGELGWVLPSSMSGPTREFMLRAGFVQRPTGLWELGTHALKSRRQAPRRVKIAARDDLRHLATKYPRGSAPVVSDGTGRPGRHAVQSFHYVSIPDKGGSLRIRCPRCHLASEVKIPAL